MLAKKFCNSACYGRFSAAANKAKLMKKRCQVCAKEILVRPVVHRYGFGKVCSPSCFSVYMAKKAKPYGRGVGGKRADLNNRYFRSRWEANYARYLNLLVKLKVVATWEYEPATFRFEGVKRGTLSYTPDFYVHYLDGRNEYHEVKGYMDPKSKTRHRRMNKYFPHIVLRIIGHKEMKELALKFSAMLPMWEKGAKHKFGL
jgi:hypothetical protein